MGKVIELVRGIQKGAVSFDVTDVKVADTSESNTSTIEEAHSTVVTCFADTDEDNGEVIAKLFFHGVVLDEYEAATIAHYVQRAFHEISMEREGF